MRFQIQLSSAKNYFLGFATSGLFLISGLYYFNSTKAPENAPTTFTGNTSEEKSNLTEFNPNDLTEVQWKELGFSERQVQTILKYKSILGGKFDSKEQIQKCYVISEEKFNELEPWILLPDHTTSTSSTPRFVSNYGSGRQNSYYSKSSYQNKKELTISGKFNPDTYSVTDFMNLGFSEKQALSILKYKGYLGGSFVSKEKFKDCFVISEENYRRLAPFLLLPEKTPEGFTTQKNYQPQNLKTEKKELAYEPFDPNLTDFEGWKNLGFSEKQAQVILNYRDRNLKGSFKSLDDISRCFVISPEKFESLKPFIVLNPENIKEKKTSYINSISSGSTDNSMKTGAILNPTDFSKTDLNEITFKQLIEFGFDERSAASYIGFRNKLVGFITKTQIMETYNIDKDLAQKLVDIAPLFTDKVPKYSLIDAPEEWLKNHPYFKYYADKVIYYRISYSDESKFFRTMKIKPEAEKRMKLYLK
ncbi:helix-hairpin-helix domain-containing protein [Kaistella polysaccharea]|uniref:helix-hairpin-helix domain-containing protein n=1 Tax=Kaistella polysaccharea TaxID=2878534 RepID=UPI001CF4515F|nr:helix-hairpin-helix domain-containing protein [Kaistella polysaccharea]